MKNRNLKIAIVAILLGSISSVGAMGRFLRPSLVNPIYSKAVVFSKRLVRPEATYFDLGCFPCKRVRLYTRYNLPCITRRLGDIE